MALARAVREPSESLQGKSVCRAQAFDEGPRADDDPRYQAEGRQKASSAPPTGVAPSGAVVLQAVRPRTTSVSLDGDFQCHIDQVGIVVDTGRQRHTAHADTPLAATTCFHQFIASLGVPVLKRTSANPLHIGDEIFSASIFCLSQVRFQLRGADLPERVQCCRLLILIARFPC